jgi:actin-like ATPase involved in cell morphogenesis
MPYALGIDLGSSHLTAAIRRNDGERWAEPEVLELDGVAQTVALLHLTDEGTVEVGDRALRQVTSRPDCVARGFVDRVGDEVPLLLGGRPYPAETLIAAVIGWIADYAEAGEGAPAAQVVVAHPAGWGSHRRAALLGALREAGLSDMTLLPRPVAAAESYSASERVEVGQEIAVHSLGAGRFEGAVLRRGSFGFELRAHADSAESVGGELFDDLLAERVLADLGHEVEPVPLAKLRVACRLAKERLSTELAVTVPAPAGSPRGTVMVNRSDIEELIRPAVEATVTSLQRTIQAAGTSTGSLRAVVLVGGSGRIPLVSELVSANVRVHVSAAADPELSVAKGAAMAAAQVAKPTVQSPPVASPAIPAAVPALLTHKPEPIARSAVTDLMSFDDLPDEELAADIGPPPPRPPVEIPPLEPPKRRLLNIGARSSDADDDFDEDERDLPPARRRREADLELSSADLRPRRRSREIEVEQSDVRPRRRSREPEPERGSAEVRPRPRRRERDPLRRYRDDDLDLSMLRGDAPDRKPEREPDRRPERASDRMPDREPGREPARRPGREPPRELKHQWPEDTMDNVPADWDEGWPGERQEPRRRHTDDSAFNESLARAARAHRSESRAASRPASRPDYLDEDVEVNGAADHDLDGDVEELGRFEAAEKRRRGRERR